MSVHSEVRSVKVLFAAASLVLNSSVLRLAPSIASAASLHFFLWASITSSSRSSFFFKPGIVLLIVS